MDFSLTTEQEEFVNEVAEFCRKNCSDVDINRLEESGEDPEDIEEKLVEAGYYGLPFPVEYGGMGKDFFYFGLLLEGLLRGGYPYPGRFQATMLNALNVFESGSEEQKKELLPKVIRGDATMSISLTEPNSGTDVAALSTKGVEKDGGFSITGQKVYSSGARGERNVIVAGVRTDPSAPRHKGITMFLIPSNTKGVEFRRLKGLGRNIGGLYEVFFDEAWVPKENILGKLNKGWLTLVNGLATERAVLGAGYLGYAERIFDDILKTAKERSVMGQPMGSHAAVAQQVAEFAMEVQAAKLLIYASLSKAIKQESTIGQVSQNKMYCSELIRRLGDFVMEMGGGFGYLKSSLHQWYFRESRIVTVGGGSSQIMRNVAAAGNLGIKVK